MGEFFFPFIFFTCNKNVRPQSSPPFGATRAVEKESKNMASSSSSSRLALRLCASIRNFGSLSSSLSSSIKQQHSRAFAASVCGETKTAAAAREERGASASSSNPSAAAASSLKGSSSSPFSNGDSNALLPLAYVFLGAPGVGKGTYSTRVADALGAEHISAGDLVRAEVKKGSELGKQVCVCFFFFVFLFVAMAETKS